jgi:hypothetical protein
MKKLLTITLTVLLSFSLVSASLTFDSNSIFSVGTESAGVEIDSSGNIDITGTQNVDGASTLTGATTITGATTLSGAMNLDNSIDADITGDTQSFSFNSSSGADSGRGIFRISQDDASMDIQSYVLELGQNVESDAEADYLVCYSSTGVSRVREFAIIEGGVLQLQDGVTLINTTDTEFEIQDAGGEDITLDLDTATDNEVVLKSGSGVTQLDIQIATLKADAIDVDNGGNINSEAADLTIGDSTNDTVFSDNGAISQTGTANQTWQDGSDLLCTANPDLAPWLSASSADSASAIITFSAGIDVDSMTFIDGGEMISNATDDTVQIASDDTSITLELYGQEASDAVIVFKPDQGDNPGDSWKVGANDGVEFIVQCDTTTADTFGAEDIRMRIYNDGRVKFQAHEATNGSLSVVSDQSDDNGDEWTFTALASGNSLTIGNDTSGSDVAKMTLTTDGRPLFSDNEMGLTAQTNTIYKVYVATVALEDDNTYTPTECNAKVGRFDLSCGTHTIAGTFNAAADVSISQGKSSTKSSGSDTDGSLCVYDGGTNIVIKNRTAATQTILGWVEYIN